MAAILAVLTGGLLGAPAGAVAALTMTTAPSDPTGVNMPDFAGAGALTDGSIVTVVLAPVGTGADPPDLSATPGPGGDWAASVPAPGLPDGTYTATATQDGNAPSASVQFMVDTTPPAPTVTQPVVAVTANQTPVLGGAAGDTAGDLPTVTVELRAGAGGSGTLVRSDVVSRIGAAWTDTAPVLAPGPYSVRATQSDSLGHTGQTAWRDFTVVAAGFTISPDPPETGKVAKFTATTPATGVTSFAWELSGDGKFDDKTGSQVTHTYANTDSRTVGLRITTADGATSVATRNITPVDHTPPTLSVTTPAPLTASDAPALGGAAGNAAGDLAKVGVEVRRFASGTGALVYSDTVTRSADTWADTVPGPLAPGVYSVRARQADQSGNTTTTPWRNFTIVAADFTIAPDQVLVGGQVTLTALTTGVSYAWDLNNDGVFDDGTTQQVSRTVTSASPQRVALKVAAPDGTSNTAYRWITPGNRAPVASFGISPAAPIAGQAVALTSTSSDPDGLALASQAWDLDGDGTFDDATGALVSIAFPAAGTYRIGLRVIDVAGAVGEATRYLTVAAAPASGGNPVPSGGSTSDVPAASPTPPPTAAVSRPTPLHRPMLSPFPIVRLVGELTRSGMRMTLLSVTAPKGATVRTRCAGRGCPRAVPAMRARRFGRLRIRRLEGRQLRQGTVVEVFVTAPGRIGKYTRFRVLRGAAPKRSDLCLADNRRTPIGCPVG